MGTTAVSDHRRRTRWKTRELYLCHHLSAQLSQLPPPKLLADDDLSEAQCAALLADLVEAYQQPAFVAKLEAFQREHGPMYVARLGPPCSRPRPIFRRHGLPPDGTSEG